MTKEIILETNLTENDYLPMAVVSKIWGVGHRQVHNIANSQDVQRLYYSARGYTDLVAFQAIGVKRVAENRKDEWPDEEQINKVIINEGLYNSERRAYHKVKNSIGKINVEENDLVATAVELPTKIVNKLNKLAPTDYSKMLSTVDELVTIFKDEIKAKKLDRCEEKAARELDLKSARNLRYFQYGASIIILITFLYIAFFKHN